MLRGLTSCLFALGVVLGLPTVVPDARAADTHGAPSVFPQRQHQARPFGIPVYGDHRPDRFGGHFGRDRGRLPSCHEPRVLERIARKWAWGEANLLSTGQYVEGIDRVHQHAEQSGGPGFIDRRYCRATATLTDGSTSEVIYLIEATQGFASHGFNVESCFPRYDPLRVHGQWCRSLRP